MRFAVASKIKASAKVGVMAATLTALTFQGAGPAAAKLDSSNITYTGSKSVTCPKGQYGFLFIEGGHVSYKKIYHKNGRETHWSITSWTAWNGADTLVRILGKTGGKRTARGYVALGKDTRHGMSSMSDFHFYTLCDSRNLTGDNYGDTVTRTSQLWRSTMWHMYYK